MNQTQFEQSSDINPVQEAANTGIDALNQAVEAMNGQPFSVERKHGYTRQMVDNSQGVQYGFRLQLAGAGLPPEERFDQVSRPLDLVMDRDMAAILVAELINQGGVLNLVLEGMDKRSVTSVLNQAQYELAERQKRVRK
jgi:hypothetical protein